MNTHFETLLFARSIVVDVGFKVFSAFVINSVKSVELRKRAGFTPIHSVFLFIVFLHNRPKPLTSIVTWKNLGPTLYSHRLVKHTRYVHSGNNISMSTFSIRLPCEIYS